LAFQFERTDVFAVGKERDSLTGLERTGDVDPFAKRKQPIFTGATLPRTVDGYLKPNLTARSDAESITSLFVPLLCDDRAPVPGIGSLGNPRLNREVASDDASTEKSPVMRGASPAGRSITVVNPSNKRAFPTAPRISWKLPSTRSSRSATLSATAPSATESNVHQATGASPTATPAVKMREATELFQDRYAHVGSFVWVNSIMALPMG